MSHLAPVEPGEHRADLVPGEDDRQPLGPLGPDDAVDAVQGPVEHRLVEEQQGAERLVLGRRRDLPVDGQVGQERDDLRPRPSRRGAACRGRG